jgi:hypothetical protein
MYLLKRILFIIKISLEEALRVLGIIQVLDNTPGAITIYIEPGSTIRKALLFVGVYGNPDRAKVNHKWNRCFIKPMQDDIRCFNNTLSSEYVLENYDKGILIIDLSNIISPSTPQL